MNGKELSKSSHEETVEAFRPAKDPVVVQVIRRTPSGRPHGPPQEIHVVNVCTQTDITFEHIMALAKLRPSTPPVPDVCPFLLSDRYAENVKLKKIGSCEHSNKWFYIISWYISFLNLDLRRYEDLGLLQQIAIQSLLLCPCLTLAEADNN